MHLYELGVLDLVQVQLGQPLPLHSSQAQDRLMDLVSLLVP